MPIPMTISHYIAFQSALSNTRVHLCLVEVTQVEYVDAHSVCQLAEGQPDCAVLG